MWESVRSEWNNASPLCPKSIIYQGRIQKFVWGYKLSKLIVELFGEVAL